MAIGIVAVIGIAVALSRSGADERQAVERIRSSPFVPRNDTPSSRPEPRAAASPPLRERAGSGSTRTEAAARPTRAALRAKMIGLLGGIPQGIVGSFGDNGKQMWIAEIGKPDRTQSIGGSYFWYYACSDGTIQVVISGALDQGDDLFAVEGINDY
ncbi:MAG: hypothetical protein AB7I45_01385 [Planctomycetota bacterium]